MIFRPILFSLLASPVGDPPLPLSPDPESAAQEAVAALRDQWIDAPIPVAAWSVLRGAGDDPRALAEAVACVRAALAEAGLPSREGEGSARAAAVVEVSHLASGGREAIALRGIRPSSSPVLAPFVRKPWVRRLPEGSETGGDLWVRGESEIEFEEGAARAGAIRRATEAVHRALAAHGAAEEILARVLPEAEIARRFVRDVFVRSELRGHGEAVRGYALLSVPAGEVERILERAASKASEAARSLRRKVAALAGVALVLFLGYVAADFATRGAFTKGLRVAALLAGLLAGGLLL